MMIRDRLESGEAGAAGADRRVGTGAGCRAWALLAGLAIAAALAPVAVEAQARAEAETDRQPAAYRRWVFAVAGAVVGAIPALVAEQADDQRGACVSRNCTVALSTSIGATIGFLVGRERDKAAASRYAAGPSVRFATQAVELELMPEGLTAYQGGAVIIGREGIAAVGDDRLVRRKGGQIRGVESVVAVPAHDALLASTASGLFSFVLQGDQPEGRLVMRETGGALQQVSANHVVMGSGDLLRRLRLTGQGALLELAEEARADSPGAVTSLAFASGAGAGVLWSLTLDRLVARSASGLEELGSVRLPAAGRSISLSGGRALIAAGSEGLFVVDVAQPQAPRLLGQVRGIQFAFDAVLKDRTAYVAAGRTGVVIVDVDDPAHPRTLGVVRDLGFVNGLALGEGGRIYVVDREGQRLFVVQTESGGQVGVR